MKLVIQTKKGSKTLNIDGEKIGDGIKKAVKSAKNHTLEGVNTVISTAEKGLEIATKATKPDADYLQNKQRSKEEKERIEREIQRRKDEIKALEQGR